MSQNEKDSSNLGDGTYPVHLRRESSMLRNEALATQCLKELVHFQRGKPCDERFGLELLRRATLEGDPDAWEWVQHCFKDVARGWLHRHPSREKAMNLESEENYIALAFGRFWQATAFNKKIEFRTIAAAMQYLRASLNGAIIDTLRTYNRPNEVSLPGTRETVEPSTEDLDESYEVLRILQSHLHDPRERRLVSLLYYYGLKPREIVRFCPQEWNDVREIYCLRRKIMDRLLCRADQLCWQLGVSRNCRNDENEDGKVNL